MTNQLHEPGLNELLYAIGILIVRAIEKRIDKKKAKKCQCRETISAPPKNYKFEVKEKED